LTSFNKNVLTIFSGTTISQILILLTTPIFTRLYNAEDFGNLGVYISIISIASIIFTLKYENAIPLIKNENRAYNLVISLFFIIFLFGITLFILLFIINNNFQIYSFFYQKIKPSSLLHKYYYVLVIGILLTSIYTVLSFWIIRKKLFLILTKTKIYQSLVSITVQFLFVFFHSGFMGLIISYIISQSFGIFTMFKSFISQNKNRKFNLKISKLVLVQNIDYPKYSVTSNLLNTLSTAIPPILLTYYFNITYAGYYVLAHRVVSMPSTLIGNSISNVFQSELYEAKSNNSLAKFGISVFHKLVQTGFSPFILLLLITPELFNLIFGTEWVQAGTFVQFLIPWLIIVFISSPISNIILVENKQKFVFFFQFLFLIIRFISIYIGYRFNNVNLAIFLFGFTSFILWIFFLKVIMKLFEIKPIDYLKIISNEILYILPYSILLVIIKMLLFYLTKNNLIGNIIVLVTTLFIGVLMLKQRILPNWIKNES